MQFVMESHIAAPPEAVFRFHESPDALRQLIPPWENMRVVEMTNGIHVGSRVVLEGKLCLFPLRWVAQHTEYDPPRLFADRQDSGPFASWYHRHLFLPAADGGTLLRDEVEYQLPLGPLGRVLGGALVRRKLDRMFVYRHKVTRRAVERE
jgi:ligand-binding SRPBCC domain-containing protein